MSDIERDDREAVRALRAEWDHAVPSAGGPSPYASWLEREVVRSRRQASGAVGRAADLQARLDAVIAACDEYAGPMYIRRIAAGDPDTGGQ